MTSKKTVYYTNYEIVKVKYTNEELQTSPMNRYPCNSMEMIPLDLCNRKRRKDVC